MRGTLPWPQTTPRFSFRMKAKSPSHPSIISAFEKGKEVGWVPRLNKGTKENGVGRAGDADVVPRESVARHGFRRHFTDPHFSHLEPGNAVQELPLAFPLHKLTHSEA